MVTQHNFIYDNSNWCIVFCKSRYYVLNCFPLKQASLQIHLKYITWSHWSISETGCLGLYNEQADKFLLKHKPFKMQHDKTNKMIVRPVKTQISLGIHPVWSSLCCPHEESLGPRLSIEWTAKTLIWLGRCPGWSESSLGTRSFCWFCHVVAHCIAVTEASSCLYDKLKPTIKTFGHPEKIL